MSNEVEIVCISSEFCLDQAVAWSDMFARIQTLAAPVVIVCISALYYCAYIRILRVCTYVL